ncbi:MAG TPA: arginine deiminase-related protein [Steroidobacteraceae bacterium]|nr:arginine deiminase-related protein [Steroidobacteraceae bacterium]
MSLAGQQGASTGGSPEYLQQCASAVLMVRPACFAFNPETAATNRMQKQPAGADASGAGAQPSTAASSGVRASSSAQALVEFDRFVSALRSEGISVCVAEDTPEPPRPDAVFPNNWVSFHEDGTLVLYPMQAENRRRERRPEIVDAVVQQLGFRVVRTVDLTRHETQGRFLEGTGSLVLDHRSRIAYACLSPRTHPEVVLEWGRELGYETVTFEATDRDGVPYYHTNVMMCVGSRMAVLGTCAMSAVDRDRVIEKLEATGHSVVEIGYDDMEQFAGNLLELASWDEALGDCRLLVMSETARRGLRPETYARLAAGADCVLAVPVPTIERLGGGSVRCMMAEVFLPARAPAK